MILNWFVHFLLFLYESMSARSKLPGVLPGTWWKGPGSPTLPHRKEQGPVKITRWENRWIIQNLRAPWIYKRLDQLGGKTLGMNFSSLFLDNSLKENGRLGGENVAAFSWAQVENCACRCPTNWNLQLLEHEGLERPWSCAYSSFVVHEVSKVT